MVPQRDPGLTSVTGVRRRPRHPFPQAAACQPVADVLRALGTTDEGLTSAEAAARRSAFGANVVATHRVTAFGVLARQLRNPLLILLLGAAGDLRGDRRHR